MHNNRGKISVNTVFSRKVTLGNIVSVKQIPCLNFDFVIRDMNLYIHVGSMS